MGQTVCPHCMRRYSVKAEAVGKRVACKGCGKEFVIEDVAGPERTESGVPVYRPERVKLEGTRGATTPYLKQIEGHIQRTIGPAPMVFHEMIPGAVHVDLHFVGAQPGVKASKERPLGGDYVTVVTSGMSARPMKVAPQATAVSPYAELMIALPKNWPGLKADGTFEQEAMKEERNWWPFRWLKQMARLPHEYGTFFSNGVTVPNGEPAKPFVGRTELCCWMVFKPLLALNARQLVISDDVRIDFFALFPLTRAEMELKLKNGLKGLLEKLADGEVYTEMIDVGRRSVV